MVCFNKQRFNSIPIYLRHKITHNEHVTNTNSKTFDCNSQIEKYGSWWPCELWDCEKWRFTASSSSSSFREEVKTKRWRYTGEYNDKHARDQSDRGYGRRLWLRNWKKLRSVRNLLTNTKKGGNLGMHTMANIPVPRIVFERLITELIGDAVPLFVGAVR